MDAIVRAWAQLVAERLAMTASKRWSVVLTCAAVTAGAQSARASTEPTEPSPDEVISIVVIGDSVPFNSPDDCPGCTSFADSYGEAVEAATGEPVAVENRSRHDGARTADIEEQLASGELTELLRAADIVIISTGLNDGPPYEGSRPCAAESLATDEELFAAVIATTTECVDEVTAEVRASVANVLNFVRTEAPEAAIGVLTAYNSWTGWENLDAAGPVTVDGVSEVITYTLDQWRTALCEEAAAVDAVCVDVYDEFNGPDGQQLSGELLAPDYSHPSQLGNDRIRDLLIASDLYDLGSGAPSTSTDSTDG